MMDILQIGKICRDLGYYERAERNLCAFSNGQIFIDGDLSGLSKQAESEGFEFLLLKGEMPKKKKDETKDKTGADTTSL